ncbi:hypothetical protein SLE2022_343530 [Rubroshorea leprosula]
MRGREKERGVHGGQRSRASGTTLSWERVGFRRRGQQQKLAVERRAHGQTERNPGRGKQKEGPVDGGLYKQATPYFFTNFPECWTYADMWRTFSHFGRVYDIYSPNRRSRNGSRFGFVRFLDVKDRKELERQLDQIWVNDMKLWVNSPRYDVVKSSSKKERSSGEGTSQRQVPNYVEAREGKYSGGRMPQVQNRSYAEVVKGNQKEIFIEEGIIQPQKTQERSKSRFRNGLHKWESRKRWQEKGKREDWVGMEYNTKPEEFAWLIGCYVGTVHSVEMVRNLQEKFYMEGYFSCKIYAIGGRMVLLDCDDKEELKDLVEMAAEWLGQWFEEVRPWTPETVANERFVWMRCQGAPLNVWGVDFFQKMGSSWGKFICLDDSTSKRKRFDIARFLISTPMTNSISVLRQIKINGIIYSIKFTEEEFTNSFFSLKQDFMPSFHSDSEDQEEWSTDSEMEEHKSENAGEELQGETEGFQEEEDDVLSSCRERERTVQSQSGQENQKSAEFVEDSLEIIQNLKIGGKNAEAVTDTIKQRKLAPSCRPEEENEADLGCKKYDLEGKKPMRQDEDLEGEVSSNMGLALGSLGVNKSIDKGNMDFYNKSVSAKDNSGDEEADLVWKGVESDCGNMQTGTSKRSEGFNKRKGQRARKCSSVYIQSFELDSESRRCWSRGRGRQNRHSGERRSIPDFEPSQNGKVAGGSIGDSEIRHCNKALKKKMQNRLAKEIWELAKHLGASTEDEDEIVRRIEEMENRDSQGKANTGKKEEAGCKKVCPIPNVNSVI